MSFASLGLGPDILRALAAAGYEHPTPIQDAAIPLVLAGRDLMAAAQTGTGKTAAFALPLLQRLAAEPDGGRGRPPRVLILAPTRELAAQILANVKAYGARLPLRATAIFGGVGMGRQVEALERGIDLVVATPGRLIDHLERGTIRLDRVQSLVLDEADRMLDMGFRPALEKILRRLPRARQTLLFSATLAPEIHQIAGRYMQAPETVSIAPPNAVAATVRHLVHPVEAGRKRELLIDLLAADSRVQTLVFGRTKHGCDKLCRVLGKHGFRAAAIHGNKSQNQRTRALADFRSGKVTILVATDIAARGIDIPQLPRVINHDLPHVPEDYVHRIGRTGRAGAEGLAISIVSREEEERLRDIQKILAADLVIEPVPGFEPDWSFDLAPRTRHGNNRRKKPRSPAPAAKARRGGRGEGAADKGRRPSRRRRRRSGKPGAAPRGA